MFRSIAGACHALRFAKNAAPTLVGERQLKLCEIPKIDIQVDVKIERRAAHIIVVGERSPGTRWVLPIIRQIRKEIAVVVTFGNRTESEGFRQHQHRR